MIIAVDFDGCLTAGGKWPDVGEPNKTLIDWLACLRSGGHKIILWTCRVDEALELAVNMCRENGLEFDAVNDNVPEIIELYGVNSRKITADYYIDDKAVFVKHESQKGESESE